MPEEVPANVPVALPKKGFPRGFGRYILEKNLSRGGMGEVFLALARGTRTRCVIKTIRGDLTGDEEFVGRFADEAKIMVRMEHPAIIRVFDCGKVGRDYYIAMEFVHGRDLGDVLDRAYERGEPMPKEIGLHIARHLLSGLGFVHNLKDERGRNMRLVHRDISPQNVLIGFDGAIKLIDFGLARTELLPGRTQGALAVGKYGYMSPEQARHERIDGRADIYSFGVMFFEVFTGDRLVDEQDQKTLWARVLNPKHRPPTTSFPDLPKEIDDLIMKAVAVRPEDRFQAAEDVIRFIDRMRSKVASRDRMLKYLRYLYPHADFTPPPLPGWAGSEMSDESEKSMIIAMSEKAAKDVFGGGELPVEWTMQINMEGLREELGRRARQPKKKQKAPTAPSTKESEAQTRKRKRMTRAPAFHEVPDEGPTTIANADHVPSRRLGEDMEDTQYERPRFPVRPSSPVTKESPLGEAQRPPSDMSHFRDDEATVMMDRPPTAALRDPRRNRDSSAGWEHEEQTQTEFVEPTQLATNPNQKKRTPEPRIESPPTGEAEIPRTRQERAVDRTHLREPDRIDSDVHPQIRAPSRTLEPEPETASDVVSSSSSSGSRMMSVALGVMAIVIAVLAAAYVLLKM